MKGLLAHWVRRLDALLEVRLAKVCSVVGRAGLPLRGRTGRLCAAPGLASSLTRPWKPGGGTNTHPTLRSFSLSPHAVVKVVEPLKHGDFVRVKVCHLETAQPKVRGTATSPAHAACARSNRSTCREEQAARLVVPRSFRCSRSPSRASEPSDAALLCLRRQVLTLKMDLAYWPTWELTLNPHSCVWKRACISAPYSALPAGAGAAAEGRAAQPLQRLTAAAAAAGGAAAAEEGGSGAGTEAAATLL